MGGLFKEYLTELSKITFTQSYGLFSVTDDNLLYPNPLSDKLFGSNHLEVFKFLGMILGKAIYEGITIQPQFAIFFLRQMLSKPIRLNDLNLMDKQLYDSLNKIKFYEGDVRDLCLTFSMADEGGFEHDIVLYIFLFYFIRFQMVLILKLRIQINYNIFVK